MRKRISLRVIPLEYTHSIPHAIPNIYIYIFTVILYIEIKEIREREKVDRYGLSPWDRARLF